MLAKELKQIMKDQPFMARLLALPNSNVYFVGGINRDDILGRKSKDADLVVCGVPLAILISALQPFGKVNTDSVNTGVIKLTLPNMPHLEEVDICLPRTEKSGKTAKYNDFVINADHTLPIESDLIRRDIRFNAIAQCIRTGKWVDPLNGREDLKNGIIRMISEKAFKEDALRMLRVSRFASILGFNLTIKTLEAIQRNAHLIVEVPKVRILKEITDIFKKGEPSIGLEMLKETHLFEHIFGYKSALNFTMLQNVKLESDFFYVLLQKQHNDSPNEITLYSDIFRDKLKEGKGSTMFKKLSILDKIFNTIKTFTFDSFSEDKLLKLRMLISSVCTVGGYDLIMNSGILAPFIKDEMLNMQQLNMPLTNADLAINGFDLINNGVENGRKIGWWLKEVRELIYKGLLTNEKNVILQYITNSKNISNYETTNY